MKMNKKMKFCHKLQKYEQQRNKFKVSTKMNEKKDIFQIN